MSGGLWCENDKRDVFSCKHVVMSRGFHGGWEAETERGSAGRGLGTGSLEAIKSLLMK